MAYEQWYPDETEEEWMAVILAVIVTGIIAGCVFGVRSCARKNKEEKPKIEQVSEQTITPQDIIEYKNTKTL